jgi:hypothetical protein
LARLEVQLFQSRFFLDYFALMVVLQMQIDIRHFDVDGQWIFKAKAEGDGFAYIGSPHIAFDDWFRKWSISHALDPIGQFLLLSSDGIEHFQSFHHVLLAHPFAG